jgi:hypothetical protein
VSEEGGILVADRTVVTAPEGLQPEMILSPCLPLALSMNVTVRNSVFTILFFS